MLAHDLVPALQTAGHEVTAASVTDLDVTEAEACRRAVTGHDVVVNTAAYTAVDAAEDDEASAFAVNATGAAHLARACEATDAALLQVSTDYVFDGTATTPYAEDAPTGPRSAYGRTKLAGEWAARGLCSRTWVLRTAWLYGAGGNSFCGTMLRLEQSHARLSVVDDQRGQPTWTGDLADRVVLMLAREVPFGVYHGTASGETTWHGLTQALFSEKGIDPGRVDRTTSEAFPRHAPRPAYSVLGHDAWQRAGIEPMRDWRAALADAASELGEQPHPI